MMKKVLKVLGYLLAAFGLLVLILFILAVSGPGVPECAYYLVLGWIPFLKRTLPQVTSNWSGIGMVVLCSFLILAGIHSFCSWLFSHRQPPTENIPLKKWRWRWTAALFLIVWILFLMSMAVVGVIHQTGWLLASPEPLLKRREYSRAILQQKAGDVLYAATGTNWNLIEIQKRLNETEGRYLAYPAYSMEALHTLFLNDTNGDFACVIIFFRDPVKQAKYGFALVEKMDNPYYEIKSFNELPKVLARYPGKGN